MATTSPHCDISDLPQITETAIDCQDKKAPQLAPRGFDILPNY
jgi:hypothetical protein